MIRAAKKEDLSKIKEIYAYAREQMRLAGNGDQWGSNRPPAEVIERDIENGDMYLVYENDELCGVFSLIIGEDPTYRSIEGGSWLNDEPYGTIHRIASNGRAKGIMQRALEFAESRIGNIRVDTHEKNTAMRSILAKNGFTQCGIIYVDDGTPRLAFQKEFTI